MWLNLTQLLGNVVNHCHSLMCGSSRHSTGRVVGIHFCEFLEDERCCRVRKENGTGRGGTQHWELFGTNWGTREKCAEDLPQQPKTQIEILKENGIFFFFHSPKAGELEGLPGREKEQSVRLAVLWSPAPGWNRSPPPPAWGCKDKQGLQRGKIQFQLQIAIARAWKGALGP